jgi:hypothetical protein
MFPFRSAALLRLVRRGLAAASLVMLASCGGGTSRVEPFVPARVIVFGDEQSVITDSGKKYTVNGLGTPPSEGAAAPLDCNVSPIWIQVVATQFGIRFPQCATTEQAAAVKGSIHAEVDARVASVLAQIQRFRATDAFSENDLVLVFAGTHDVLDAYARFPLTDLETLKRELFAVGQSLGREVNAITNDGRGGRVLFVTVPDVGLTPFAEAQKAANTDTDRVVVLRALTERFNAGLRTAVINDGSLAGLVAGDEMTQVYKRIAIAYGYTVTNTTVAACNVALPDCTTSTTVEAAAGGKVANYLWADSLRLSATGQAALGAIARTRAVNNPF